MAGLDANGGDFTAFFFFFPLRLLGSQGDGSLSLGATSSDDGCRTGSRAALGPTSPPLPDARARNVLSDLGRRGRRGETCGQSRRRCAGHDERISEPRYVTKEPRKPYAKRKTPVATFHLTVPRTRNARMRAAWPQEADSWRQAVAGGGTGGLFWGMMKTFWN